MNPITDIRLLKYGRVDYRPHVDKSAAKPTRRRRFSLTAIVVLMASVTLIGSLAA